MALLDCRASGTIYFTTDENVEGPWLNDAKSEKAVRSCRISLRGSDWMEALSWILADSNGVSNAADGH